MNEDSIEVINENIIEISYDTFIIEYNVNQDTWIAYYNDPDIYDYMIVIDGKVIDEDEGEPKDIYNYTMNEDKIVFDYLLTVEEFTELKKAVKESLI